jgi:hypothetical protein
MRPRVVPDNANAGFWKALVSQALGASKILKSRADILSLQEDKVHMKELWALFKEYDVDRSGSLDKEELSNLIAHHAIKSGTGTTMLQSPSEAEISWILKAAGKYKQNLIHVGEVELALQLWSSYVRNRDIIEYFFDKYDTSRNERLDFNQMKLYLTDLQGISPKVIVRCDLIPSTLTISRLRSDIRHLSAQTMTLHTHRQAGLRGPRPHARRQRRRRHQPDANYPGNVALVPHPPPRARAHIPATRRAGRAGTDGTACSLEQGPPVKRSNGV